MNLGITFEEKILEKITLEEYINFIKTNNISFLEFAPNLNKYKSKFYENIFKLIEPLDINIHFHLPHFINERLDVTNFNNKNKSDFIEFYKFISTINNNKITKLIFHGAKYNNSTKYEALRKTNEFINFSLKYFKNNNLNIILSIETLNKKDNKVIGDSRIDLTTLCNNYKELKICWDLTHDYLNNKKIVIPSKRFLKKVNHCHIHGFHKKESHIPLNGNNLLNKYIEIIYQENLDINIELLYCENYIQELKKDINFIKKRNH